MLTLIRFGNHVLICNSTQCENTVRYVQWWVLMRRYLSRSYMLIRLKLSKADHIPMLKLTHDQKETPAYTKHKHARILLNIYADLL